MLRCVTDLLRLVGGVLIVLGAALPAVLLVHRLRQSTILGYLVAGLAIGPFGLGLIRPEEIDIFAEVGVALLLFTIGLEFRPSILLRTLRVTVGGGLIQIVLTAATATAALAVFGGAIGASGEAVTRTQAIVFGAAVALSSTAIVLKTFADRDESDASHARVAFGILILQDLATVPIIILLPALKAGAEGGADTLLEAALSFGFAIGKAAAILAVLWLLSGVVVERLLYAAARTRSQEIFVIAVIVLLFGAAFGSTLVGLSLALGAFFGGMILSESEYSHQVLAEVLPFKACFQAIFFVSIGMLLDPVWVWEHLLAVVAAVVAIVVGKAAIAAIATRLVGTPTAVAVAAGIALAQIGEFSFVIAREASALGLMTPYLFKLTISAAVLTMAAAPPLIGVARRIADAVAPRLPVIVPRRLRRRPEMPGPSPRTEDEALRVEAGRHEGHVVIVGFGPIGRDVAAFLLDSGVPFVATELNPATVRDFRAAGVPVFFGDGTSETVLREAGVPRAKAVLVTVPDVHTSERVVEAARRLSARVLIVARTKYRAHVEAMMRRGADACVEEEFETAFEMVVRLARALDLPRRRVASVMTALRLERYAREGTVHDRTAPAFDIEQFELGPQSPLAGRSIGELDVRRRTGATILALASTGAEKEPAANPGPEVVLEPGDIHTVAGTHDQLERFERFARGEPKEAGEPEPPG